MFFRFLNGESGVQIRTPGRKQKIENMVCIILVILYVPVENLHCKVYHYHKGFVDKRVNVALIFKYKSKSFSRIIKKLAVSSERFLAVIS